MVTDLVGNQSHAQEANRAVYYYSQVNENRFGYIKRCYEKENKTKQRKKGQRILLQFFSPPHPFHLNSNLVENGKECKGEESQSLDDIMEDTRNGNSEKCEHQNSPPPSSI